MIKSNLLSKKKVFFKSATTLFFCSCCCCCCYCCSSLSYNKKFWYSLTGVVNISCRVVNIHTFAFQYFEILLDYAPSSFWPTALREMLRYQLHHGIVRLFSFLFMDFKLLRALPVSSRLVSVLGHWIIFISVAWTAWCIFWSAAAIKFIWKRMLYVFIGANPTLTPRLKLDHFLASQYYYGKRKIIIRGNWWNNQNRT